MGRIIVLASAVFLIIPAQQVAQSEPHQAPAVSDYIRAEVRGTLDIAPNTEFVPDANPAAKMGAALVVVAIPKDQGLGTSLRYELLIKDRKVFDIAARGNGKKAIVSGEMFNIAEYSARPTKTMTFKTYIHVKSLRLIDSEPVQE